MKRPRNEIRTENEDQGTEEAVPTYANRFMKHLKNNVDDSRILELLKFDEGFSDEQTKLAILNAFTNEYLSVTHILAGHNGDSEIIPGVVFRNVWGMNEISRGGVGGEVLGFKICSKVTMRGAFMVTFLKDAIKVECETVELPKEYEGVVNVIKELNKIFRGRGQDDARCYFKHKE